MFSFNDNKITLPSLLLKGEKLRNRVGPIILYFMQGDLMQAMDTLYLEKVTILLQSILQVNI